MKVKSESEVAQSCLTLSDPMDYSLPGSSVHGIFQARVLEWGAIAFSVGISSFPEEISSLSHFVVFLYFFALIAKEGFLISPCYFWNSAFRCLYLSISSLLFISLLFTAICKASSDSHFAFLHFFFFGDGLDPCPLNNLENGAVATGLEKVSFHSNPKKGNAKECSNYHTIAFISHAGKVMLKILQARLQQYVNYELPDVQSGFRKGRGTNQSLTSS